MDVTNALPIYNRFSILHEAITEHHQLAMIDHSDCYTNLKKLTEVLYQSKILVLQKE